MRWITDYRPGDPLVELRGCVATLGVFDGIHMGHRAILDRTLSWARTEDRKAVVLTFAIHPDLVVHGKAPPLLMSLEHRRRELMRCGMDAALALEFNEELRRTEAEEFVEKILVQSLEIRGLVLGHDTAVGRERRGDARLLDQLGEHHGFEVHVVGEIAVDGTIVSSTSIREALSRGDLEHASKLLGRSPSLLGRVVQGDRRGRTLGFPTANLDVGASCHPAEGVYAVLAIRGGPAGGHTHEGLCNIGRRPTFKRDDPPVIEVHLLDFDGDLYGDELEVVFLTRLRSEKKFGGVEELKQQIAADRAAARDTFRRVHRPGAGA